MQLDSGGRLQPDSGALQNDVGIVPLLALFHFGQKFIDTAATAAAAADQNVSRMNRKHDRAITFKLMQTTLNEVPEVEHDKQHSPK